MIKRFQVSLTLTQATTSAWRRRRLSNLTKPWKLPPLYEQRHLLVEFHQSISETVTLTQVNISPSSVTEEALMFLKGI